MSNPIITTGAVRVLTEDRIAPDHKNQMDINGPGKGDLLSGKKDLRVAIVWKIMVVAKRGDAAGKEDHLLPLKDLLDWTSPMTTLVG